MSKAACRRKRSRSGKWHAQKWRRRAELMAFVLRPCFRRACSRAPCFIVHQQFCSPAIQHLIRALSLLCISENRTIDNVSAQKHRGLVLVPVLTAGSAWPLPPPWSSIAELCPALPLTTVAPVAPKQLSKTLAHWREKECTRPRSHIEGAEDGVVCGCKRSKPVHHAALASLAPLPYTHI